MLSQSTCTDLGFVSSRNAPSPNDVAVGTARVCRVLKFGDGGDLSLPVVDDVSTTPPRAPGSVVFDETLDIPYYSDGTEWIPFGFDIPPYTPGEVVVFLADAANGGNDANDGLTASAPKLTLPAALETLRDFRSDAGVVEIVGSSTIDLSSTPTIDITRLEDRFVRIIIRGQRLITVSGISQGVAQTTPLDSRDPRFLWATVTTTGGLTPGALAQQIYRDLTLDKVFAVQGNSATDIDLAGGFTGSFAFGFGEGAGDEFVVYTTQAVISSPSTQLTILTKTLPLRLEDLDFQPSTDGVTFGPDVRGGEMVVHLRGALYSPPASFAGPLNFSVLVEGCFLSTRGGGSPTGYITRSDRLTSQIIANSYIENATTQPFGARVKLWGSYFDLNAFIQFINCIVDCSACWFVGADADAVSFSAGTTARCTQCRWDSAVGRALVVEVSSVVVANDSTFDTCGTFASCESSSSLRMRRNTFNISTGTGVNFSGGSQGAVRDSSMTAAGGVGILVTEDANISVDSTSIESSGSHGIRATRGGELFVNGVTIGLSGGDGIRLETGSELHGGTVGDGGGAAAAATFHVIHIATGSEVALDAVPTATPTTVGNDYRVGVAGTKSKAIVSAGAAADVNDGFSGATPVENCSISTP